LEFAEKPAVLNSAGTTVIADTGEEQRVGSKFAVHRAELTEVFAKQSIGLFLGELNTFLVRLSGLDLVSITDVWPMLWFV
jgi:hypothetical protein